MTRIWNPYVSGLMNYAARTIDQYFAPAAIQALMTSTSASLIRGPVGGMGRPSPGAAVTAKTNGVVAGLPGWLGDRKARIVLGTLKSKSASTLLLSLAL